ncbi:MAG TPA: PilX N-terminal domain-containing pilus assembly protein [Gemmatimonadota bacterium]
MSERGATLVVVLWALVALSALSLVAAVGAVLDLRLAARHREHAAALAAAETGLAEALAAVWRDPARAARIDSLSGSGAGGSWTARWSPSGSGLRLLATGADGSATRAVEAWAEPDPGPGWRIVGWREIR